MALGTLSFQAGKLHDTIFIREIPHKLRTNNKYRNPKKHFAWQDELLNAGATIRVEPLDVADKQDLVRLYRNLTKVMPPIAGVINGAMVLSDGLFVDMSYESLEKVLKPKIDGSKNLDEVFLSNELDFFIMFSSLSAVVGNPGQANYAAANMVSNPPYIREP